MEAVIVISEISEVASTCLRTHGLKTEVCLITFILLFINFFYFILTVKCVALTCEPADACLKILVIGSSYITVCPSQSFVGILVWFNPTCVYLCMEFL